MNADSRSSFRLSLAAVILVALVFVFVKVRQVAGDGHFIPQSYAISWDGYGYYLHLPATVIYKDPGMENRAWLDSLNAKYQEGRPFYQAVPGTSGRQVNVYTTGTAIAWLPFFLGGHAFAKLSGYPADGLSPPYQYAIILAGLFYGIFGMLLLRKLLLRYTGDTTAAFILLLTGLGTNLYMYASYECTINHVILFAFDTGIVLLTISWHENPDRKTAVFLGLCLGLVIIVRPTEIAWCILPLLWNVNGIRSFAEKFRLLKKHYADVLLLFAGTAAMGMIQLLYWKFTSGNWISNNHTEGFDFLHPFTSEALFSFKKGWFVYTPVMGLAALSLFFLLKNKNRIFIPVFSFFLVNLWLVSSWECWWYAGSFGQRAFVQSYGLMALPLALAFEAAARKKIMRFVFPSLLLLLLLLNQFQSWQYVHGIIPGDRMTGEYYRKIFGRTAYHPEWENLLEIDRGNLPPLESVKQNYRERAPLVFDFSEVKTNGALAICDTAGLGDRRPLLLDAEHEYYALLDAPFDSLTAKDHLRFRFTADVFAENDLAGKNFNLVFFADGKRDQQYGSVYTAFDTAQVHPGKWSRIQADFVSPYMLHRNDRIRFLLWNSGRTRLLFDNARIEIFEPQR